MTKNRTRTPVYLDPGMHPGLEVKGLTTAPGPLPYTFAQKYQSTPLQWFPGSSQYRPQWLIPSDCDSKLRGTEFETRPGRIFVIEVVNIQCSKLFKGLGCIVLSMVLCTIGNLWSHSLRVGHSPDVGLFSVAILPWLSTKRLKAIFTIHSHYHNHGNTGETNDGIMLGQRRRRWPSITPSLLEPLVFPFQFLTCYTASTEVLSTTYRQQHEVKSRSTTPRRPCCDTDRLVVSQLIVTLLIIGNGIKYVLQLNSILLC